MKKKLKELAEWVHGTVVGDGEVEIHGVASIEDAKEGEITFIANPKYLSKLGQTQASAVIVSPEVTSGEKPLLCVKNPYLAFAKILTLFSHKPYQPKGVDPKAWVSPDSPIGQRSHRLPFCLHRRPLPYWRSGHPLSRGLRGRGFLHRRRLHPPSQRLHLSRNGRSENGSSCTAAWWWEAMGLDMQKRGRRT